MSTGLGEDLVSRMDPRMRVRTGMNLERLLTLDGLTQIRKSWVDCINFAMIIKNNSHLHSYSY